MFTCVLFYRLTLFGIVYRAVQPNFRMPIEKVCANLMPEDENVLTDSHIRNLFFGNYIEPDANPKVYDEVNKQTKNYLFILPRT